MPVTRAWIVAVFTAIVPVVVIDGPPVSPVPVATLVTVPVPPAAAHVHAVPLHFGTWFAVQAVVGRSCVVASEIVPEAVIGPPVSPAPVATLVTVPSSVSHTTVPSALMVRMLEPAAQVPLTRRCRYAVSAAIVPVVVTGPPVSPAPVATLVTVPAPAVSVPQAHPPAPLLFGTCPLLHACGS